MKSVGKLHGIFPVSTFCKNISTRFTTLLNKGECVNNYFGESKDTLSHHINFMRYNSESPVLQCDGIN